MVQKVVIRDVEKSPVNYLPCVKTLHNGMEFTFREGPNIIVGENGCGKSTLLKLIRAYQLIEYMEPDVRNCRYLYRNYNLNMLLDGVDVYGDYKKATFNMCRAEEYKMNSDFILSDLDMVGSVYTQGNSSTGEGILNAVWHLLNKIFNRDIKIKFPKIEDEEYHLYLDYIKEHTVDCTPIITLLLDEPDRNLSLDNLEQVKTLVSYKRDDVQTISVIHNPLLISAVSKLSDVNIIEMTDDYVDKVNEQIKKLANQLCK